MQTSVDNWREGTRTGHTPEPNDATLRLDGLGRQLADLSADPAPAEPPEDAAPAEPPEGPVFVDESGRRSKTYRRLGWFLATVCAVYAVTLVVAVLGGNSSAPFLPISGQEEQQADDVEVPLTPSTSTSPTAEPPGATTAPSLPDTDPATGSEASADTPASAPGSAAGTGTSASRSPAPPSDGRSSADSGPGPSASEPATGGPSAPETNPEDPDVTGPPPPTPSEPTVQPGEGAH
ncbi:hypothetical protein OG909_10785 [Streptomyces sp. NBC_01754]|uniref:hypothetical protein n=1 Tax=Streptomyces sp. NBC_01754 TaxID=2975930 RepID=UPI002DDC15BC|nr:hypothetical protein [Streptomyces sp. NBC_01754]WSC92738.1 hypothetical protein OG909_10785 [Streptomyces sp. NBC_01754]